MLIVFTTLNCLISYIAKKKVESAWFSNHRHVCLHFLNCCFVGKYHMLSNLWNVTADN